MKVDMEDTALWPKDVAGPIAVVGVDVDHREPVREAPVQEVSRGDGDVVDETETLEALTARVVARSPHEAEGVIRVALDHPLRGLDHPARAEQRDVEVT